MKKKYTQSLSPEGRKKSRLIANLSDVRGAGIEQTSQQQ